MIKCNDCDKPATHIFKAHMPLTPLNENAEGNLILDREEYELNRAYAHKINIFFCDDCAVNDPLYFDKLNNSQLRYVKMRTVDIVPETTVDTWEKQWVYLYEWQGEYIMVEPRAYIYRVERVGAHAEFVRDYFPRHAKDKELDREQDGMS